MAEFFGEVTSPLTTRQIGDRVYESQDRYISGHVWVRLDSIVSASADEFRDFAARKLTLSGMLDDVSWTIANYTPTSVKILIAGDATRLLGDYHGDEGHESPRTEQTGGIKMSEQPRLCFVKGPWAYFTTCAVPDQPADDWDRAPYETNASRPFEWVEGHGVPPYQLMKVAWEGRFSLPTIEDLGRGYSVRQVNRRFVPWLTPWDDTGEPVFAGDTVEEFTRKVTTGGGTVYFAQPGPG